jgi:DNA processing protein
VAADPHLPPDRLAWLALRLDRDGRSLQRALLRGWLARLRDAADLLGPTARDQPEDPLRSALAAAWASGTLSPLLPLAAPVRGGRAPVPGPLPRSPALACARRMAACGQRLLVPWDSAWPPLLAAFPGAPPVLFVRGAGALPDPLGGAACAASVAIVGARRVDPQGAALAQSLARDLARAGIHVVSGLAYGVDAAAHQGALDGGGATTAVLAGGVERPHPAGNRALGERIAASPAGVLCSEWPPGVGPRAAYFPERNRIVAGLAQAVLVVRAGQRSGALITARYAADGGRDVLAVPGSVFDPLSGGCHQLLRDGAGLVECADDVLAALGVEAPAPAGSTDEAAERAVAVDPDPSARAVLERLARGSADADTLAADTAVPVHRLLGILARLELEGRIAVDAGCCTLLPPGSRKAHTGR